MRRSELELSINWVRRLLPDDGQLVIIGSQSILGAFNEVLLPDDARLSMEVDVLPLRDPDERKADLIEVMLGRDSAFHERFGIYVDGVSPATARFAPGWLARTIPFVVSDSTGTVPDTVAWCAHPADLVANKLTVTREGAGVLPRRAAPTTREPGRRRAPRRWGSGTAQEPAFSACRGPHRDRGGGARSRSASRRPSNTAAGDRPRRSTSLLARRSSWTHADIGISGRGRNGGDRPSRRTRHSRRHSGMAGRARR